eukprot:245827-Heterocapsa_arctica.AAC.1
MKLAVTIRRPFGHVSGQMTNCAEKVETSETGSIQDLHTHFCSDRLQFANVGQRRRERPPRIRRRGRSIASET